MKAPKTLQQAIQFFADYENCRQFMIAMRWDDGVVRCPYCNSDKVSYLEKSRLYFCPSKHPKQKFSLKVGTVFEDSPIGLDKWLPVTWLLCNCKNGISSYEIARAVGVTQKSAWFMLHRVREAMKNQLFRQIGKRRSRGSRRDFCRRQNQEHASFAGTREIQGNPLAGEQCQDNRHGNSRPRHPRVRTKVIPNTSRETLQSEILKQVVEAGTVYTDMAQGYYSLDVHQFVHETVNHLEEYVRGEVHTNGIENFWSL